MATLADIAREANCSVNLVSYVLKKTTPVKSEKHRKILEIADRMNYVSNKVASALITGKTNSVTLIVGGDYYLNLHQSFFIEFLYASMQKFTAHGIGLTLYAPYENDEDQLKNIVLNGSSDGVIWYMAHIPESIKTILTERRYPSLIVLGQDDSMSYINTDDYTSEIKILEYLYRCNHRRILFAGQQDSLRYKAYCDFMDRYQLPYKRLLEMDYMGLRNEQRLKEYLKNYGCDFTAIAFWQDTAAISMMRVLQNEGIRIPDDVSVVGYDDLPEAQLCTPQLTTVRQDYNRLAKATVDFMMEKINRTNPDAVSKITLVQDFIIRDSVRVIPLE